jgi:hypothetical protein
VPRRQEVVGAVVPSSSVPQLHWALVHQMEVLPGMARFRQCLCLELGLSEHPKKLEVRLRRASPSPQT